MEKRKTAGANKPAVAQTPTPPKPKQAKKNPKMTRNWEDPAVEVGSTVRASAFGVQKSERALLKNKRTRIIAIVSVLVVIVICIISVITAAASNGSRHSSPPIVPNINEYTPPSPPPKDDYNFTSTDAEE
ncbi:hypothetical protein M514_00313 [Trichuris suis]|uniref:Uncharacterized protein n=1 Tax=Trichuris suis TaxID=68888 RepID=A0A085NGI9_9BILA|nr:hypothetical protein M513_00313 [Trichuris suis]KFD68585.1 hypothetical protein M514_00313 [Trichuris suis]KHJ44023.1 hypothetical protein D918_05716 [Trichuris suis]